MKTEKEIREEMKEVQLVKRGWSSDAGYIWWAHVCEIDIGQSTYRGKKLFEPNNNTRRDNVMFPVLSCEKWCKKKGYKIIRRTIGMTS